MICGQYKSISIQLSFFFFNKFYNWIKNHYAHTQNKSIQKRNQAFCFTLVFQLLSTFLLYNFKPTLFYFPTKDKCKRNCTSLMIKIWLLRREREKWPVELHPLVVSPKAWIWKPWKPGDNPVIFPVTWVVPTQSQWNQ